jgi:hypothetical protein
LAACQVPPGASQSAGVVGSDLGGVVTGANGPEAGVWVIAETTDLPTKFAKIVVTDDRGRYLIPELPRAAYKVWVRGYWASLASGHLGKFDRSKCKGPLNGPNATVEGGKENRPRVVKFQLRPDPLAR